MTSGRVKQNVHRPTDTLREMIIPERDGVMVRVDAPGLTHRKPSLGYSSPVPCVCTSREVQGTSCWRLDARQEGQ